MGRSQSDWPQLAHSAGDLMRAPCGLPEPPSSPRLRDLEAYAARDKESLFSFADCLAAVGDATRRFAGSQTPSIWASSTTASSRRVIRSWRPLRGDPRFEVLMDKAREKQRAFEV